MLKSIRTLLYSILWMASISTAAAQSLEYNIAVSPDVVEAAHEVDRWRMYRFIDPKIVIGNEVFDIAHHRVSAAGFCAMQGMDLKYASPVYSESEEGETENLIHIRDDGAAAAVGSGLKAGSIFCQAKR